METSQNGVITRTVVFFREEAVRVGEVVPIHFPPARRSPRGLLPRLVADSIPFATSALPDILARFGFAVGSFEEAKTERTLGMCETPSLAWDAKFCATSLEAKVEGTVAALGTQYIRPVTSALPRSGAPLQQYTIRAVRPVEGSRFVASTIFQQVPQFFFLKHVNVVLSHKRHQTSECQPDKLITINSNVSLRNKYCPADDIVSQ